MSFSGRPPCELFFPALFPPCLIVSFPAFAAVPFFFVRPNLPLLTLRLRPRHPKGFPHHFTPRIPVGDENRGPLTSPDALFMHIFTATVFFPHQWPLSA